MKMYIAVLDTVPDHMVPVLVAHSVINAHRLMEPNEKYQQWLGHYFKKCVLRVNQKEFDKISQLSCMVWLGHEVTTLDGKHSCAVVQPMEDSEIPNVLKFAKLWKPK